MINKCFEDSSMKLFKTHEKDNQKILTKYTGMDAVVFIPENIQIINRHAFSKCETIHVIHIPSSVQIIETEAFYGCHSLEEIHFSEGLLEIRHRAFWFCNRLTQVVFPESLQLIGSRTFECCSRLSSITLKNEGTFIDEYAFNETPYWHETLKKAALCSPRNNSGICPKELHFPEGITHIDIWAYSGSKIESAVLPNSLRTMGMSAFKDCKFLKEISLTPNVYCNYNIIPGPADGIFAGCTQLEQITIRGELVNFIWDQATEPEFLKGFDRQKTFAGCTNLKRMIAWKVPLSKIPSEWQRYAINGYISDMERQKHYSPSIASEYEEKTAQMKEQLIKRTQLDKSFALYEYLMSRHFITEDNFDSLLTQAIEAECTTIAAALLEYKQKFLTSLNTTDILFSGSDEL